MAVLHALRRPTGFRQILAAIFLCAATALTVGSALAFEHVGGYIPCALCLEQRIPYYLAIPAALAAGLRGPGVLTRGLLLLVGLLMLWGLALGAYHAGVEWGFWPGPADCAAGGAVDLSGGDLLSQIDAVRPPSCSQAALRILGLSLAGWNALLAAFFAVVALRSAFARADRFAR